ncbi:hypothetical protein BJV74DRAFT_883311 [Russula compacta]|nr:hypothetical protein BJV74DRAFT_883311 [Russula compacta]
MASPYAFVTLLTSDYYLPGALTVAAALKDIHPSPALPPEVDFQTVCLVTPETVDIASIKLLRKAFDVVVGVEIIQGDNERGLQLLGRPDLSTVLTKLHIFRLSQFSKIIFLDADVLPIRPLSHLFTLPHDFSAVPDVGWPDIFNSGFMVLSPGEDKFTELMELSKTKGSWDGADQGLLNEWRGSNWNRLSFTYNTTPTAVYTYAPAYERFGSQISAIHFIGANKPWSSIPWRAPGSTTAQLAASQPLQAYDYGSLVDRWYAVYDKHYRSQPVIPQAAFWGSLIPPTSVLSLEDLRRIAIEGFSGFSNVPRTSAATTGEGSYISLPLEGRLDLMRPRPGPEKGHESGAGADGQRAPGASARDQLTFDDSARSSTPKAQPSPFYVADLPHDRPTSDSAPYEFPSALHFGPEPGATISPAFGSPQQAGMQPATAARLQVQPGPTSSLPQNLARSYYSAEPSHSPPQSYIPWVLTIGKFQTFKDHFQDTSRAPAIDMFGVFEGQLQDTDKSHNQMGTSGLPHGHRQFFEPEYVSTSAAPTRPRKVTRSKYLGCHDSMSAQELIHQVTQRLPQTDQAQVSREFYVQEGVHAPKLGAQQVHPEQNTSLLRQPEPHHEYDHRQAPPLKNLESSSPSQVTSTHFTIPPPSRIPDHLLQEKHYVNVLGESQQGETPSPDRAKIKPVFPWEDKPRLTPDRVFPPTDSPPPGQFSLPAVEPASPSPSPPLRFFPTQSYTSSPPSGFPPSFSYGNVWDSVPSIQKYASRLVRSPQKVPPLAPAFDFSESRRGESALFRNWNESGESSVDGDDEDTSDEGEEAHQASSTIPKETRDQSVQVTILTDSADADRSIKDKGEGSLSSALAVKQQELSPLGSPTGLRSPRFASPRGSSTNLAESTPRPVLYKPTQRPITPQRSTELQRLLPTSISRTFSSDTPSSPSSVGPPISPEDPRPVRRAGGRVWDPARGVEIFKRGSEEVLARFLKYETSAAIIETETSTVELAQQVRNHATQERIAAKEAALIAGAQPHLPSGALRARDTTTAAHAEAQQATPEAAQEVQATAEHAKGVAEHAASTAHKWGPGVTGNAYDAVTQLRAKVEEATDAAVTDGQKNVQAAVNAGASYFDQAKNLASSAISTAAPHRRKNGGTTKSAQEDTENIAPSGGAPASSAALESGPHAVSNPYPTSDVHAKQLAVNKSE